LILSLIVFISQKSKLYSFLSSSSSIVFSRRASSQRKVIWISFKIAKNSRRLKKLNQLKKSKKIVYVKQSKKTSKFLRFSRWLMSILNSETSKTFYFKEYNIIEFLKRYENLCVNYNLKKKEMIKCFSKYYDVIIEQYVRIVTIKKNTWKNLCQILNKNNRNKNLNHQVYFIEYFKVFKNKQRIQLKKVSFYCWQFFVIFEKLIHSNKLQVVLKIV
jgi:hypothetical protein